MTDWRPSAHWSQLCARAELLQDLREFFAQRDVLEVETPLLAQAPVTEVHTPAFAIGGRYLQTSPEYAMKRLLAAGSGAIYQICKAFRDESAGSQHNPEFTLLEWYRPGWGWQQLADECCELLGQILGVAEVETLSYGQLFQRYLNIDPHTVTVPQLQSICAQQVGEHPLSANDSRDAFLDLLLTHCIEPQLAKLPGLLVLHDYPASQAALAKIENNADGVAVAQRFEIFYRGLELANGYFELQDAAQQRQRFNQDLVERQQLGLPAVPVDERLLAALQHGLPSCAGVAMGVDRLLMLQQQQNSIAQVLSFSWDLA